MQADWTVACGADDPTVVLPWNTEDGSLRYVDLRTTPAAIREIQEAAQYPCLATALRRWNQPDSPLFTAKCDVWNYAADLFDAEDLSGYAYAQGSYIDLLARKAETFSSFAASEHLLRSWTERTRLIEIAEGRCEWTLRPARIFSTTGNPVEVSSGDAYIDGFATTLYVWGYGQLSEIAADAWSTALLALIEPVLLVVKS